LNTLAVPFGLAGLAETWATSGGVLGWPTGVVGWVWLLPAAAWVVLVGAHLHRGAVTGKPLGAQLRHPAQGPIAALVPVVLMLLGAAIVPVAPVLGRIVVAVAMAAAAVLAGWLVRYWLSGDLAIDAVHGGYFLPTVAGAFIAADCAVVCGWPGLAVGCFLLGCLFWIVVLTLLIARLAVRPPLPDPLVPTLAIIAAPPAVGGIAWFALHGGRADDVQAGLAAACVLMVLVQVFLLPRYLRTAFSLGFWSFTFPAAAVATYAVDWSRVAVPGGGDAAVAVVALVLVTGLVLGIATRTLLQLARDRAAGRADAAERVLVAADRRAVR
jgi:tellurite resistance protein